MSDIAYLIATEIDDLRAAANIAVRGLRKLGGFKGEIVVFTEAPFDLPDDVEQIVLPKSELPRPAVKMRCGRKLDLESYDRVLYLDADVLVRFPLDEILARCKDALVCTNDMGAKTTQDFFCRCFDETDLARFGELPGINAGFFCAPGAKLRGWLDRWERVLEQFAETPGAGIDQPPFNFCLRHGLIPLEYIPEQMWFPRYHWHSPDWAGTVMPVYERTRKAAPVVHFVGVRVHHDQLVEMQTQYAFNLLSKPFRALAKTG